MPSDHKQDAGSTVDTKATEGGEKSSPDISNRIAALKTKATSNASSIVEKTAALNELKSLQNNPEAAKLIAAIQEAISQGTDAVAAENLKTAHIADASSVTTAFTNTAYNYMAPDEQKFFNSLGDHHMTELKVGNKTFSDSLDIQNQLEQSFAQVKFAGMEAAQQKKINDMLTERVAAAVEREKIKPEDANAAMDPLADLMNLNNKGLEALKNDLHALRQFREAQLTNIETGKPDDAKVKALNEGFESVIKGIELLIKDQNTYDALPSKDDVEKAFKKDKGKELDEGKLELKDKINNDIIKTLLLGMSAAEKIMKTGQIGRTDDTEGRFGGLPDNVKATVASNNKNPAAKRSHDVAV